MADESTLSPTARLLGLVLATYGNADGTSIRPSIATLMKRMGNVSDSTVRRAKRELIAAGLVTVVERPGSSSEYRLRLPVVQLTPVTDDTPPLSLVTPDQTTDQTSREEGASLVDVLAEMVETVNPRAAGQVRRSPEVAAHARRQAAAGFDDEHVREAWAERPPKVIGTGAGFGVALLERLGSPLSKDRWTRTGTRSGRRLGGAPVSHDEFEKYGPGLHDLNDLIAIAREEQPTA